MKTPSPPPPLARALVSRLLQGEMREIVLGDLDEEFTRSLEAGTAPSDARRRYWRQALASVVAGSGEPGASRNPLRLQQTPAEGAWTLINRGLRDLRYAGRLVRRQPAFSGTAILTLAGGSEFVEFALAMVFFVAFLVGPHRGDVARL